jgi:two-component system chemotaxis response regulator CheY
VNILVVDDSKLSRKMLIRSFPDSVIENSEIIQGENGQEGFELYQKHTPEIVFLDLTMPIMDGFEALEKIIEYDKDAFVVIVTADIQVKAKEKVLSLGAKYMEHKPITKERVNFIFKSLSWI